MLADPSGYDAIVLVNDGLAGHLGIMVQDEEDQWHHFYWGSSNGNSSSSSFSSAWPWGCKPKTWCIQYCGELELLDINASGQYESYDRFVRLYGDFSSCLNEMENPSGEYNLYNNNCAQKLLGILAEADTIYSSSLYDAANYWRPSRAYDNLISNLPTVNKPNLFSSLAARILFEVHRIKSLMEAVFS